jgi:two-component system chemotaxis response regulator CheB
LFRSAALAHGPRVVGVVLTGLLDDGTAGLGVIKRCGGVTVVQEPAEALFPPMPQSALDHVHVDHRVGIREMGPLFGRLAGSVGAASAAASSGANARTMETDVLAMDRCQRSDSGSAEIRSVAPVSCPECGGRVALVHDERPRRYLCGLGHALSVTAAFHGATAAFERSLWASLHLLEERAKILDKMAEDERRHGRGASAAAYAERCVESQQHAGEIRTLLDGRNMS